MTWYPQDYVAKVPMTNMNMRANPARGYPGRTYRFYKGPVVYPFSYGLSYSTYSHSLVRAPEHISVPLTTLENTTHLTRHSHRLAHLHCGIPSFKIHVNVKNTGSMDGSHTLLVFSSPPAGEWLVTKQLVGFEKVHVAAGSERQVRVEIHVCKHLSVADQFGIRRVPMGEHQLHIGDGLKHSVTLKASLGETRI